MSQESPTKVALVTGGSFGIGRAAAIGFAEGGAHVVVADCVIDPEQITVKRIRAMGRKVLFISCDVSNENDVRRMLEEVDQVFGRLDYAFNNAGIEGLSASTADCTPENFDHTLSVNLRGVWLCMKYEIPLMLKNSKGSIVNCSSVAGLMGFENMPAYVASKHGVIGLTRTAALEYARRGIRVNAICPGVIHTPMVDRVTHGDPEVEKMYTSMEPMGRMGEPEEVAHLVRFLCSENASFITGAIVPVDGGWTAK